jgi:hypothetical protein
VLPGCADNVIRRARGLSDIGEPDLEEPILIEVGIEFRVVGPTAIVRR